MRPAPGRLSPVPDRLEDARRALDEVLGTTEFRDHSRWRDAIDTELPAAVTYTESFFEYADARWERHWTAVHERRKYPLNRVTPRLVLEMSLVVVALALALQWWPPEDVGLIYLLCALAGALWALSALQEWRRMGRDARVMRWEAIETDAWFRRYLRIAVAETASRVINRRAENLAFPVDAPRTDLSIEPLIAWDMDEWDMDLDESVELVDRRIVGAPRVLSVLCHAVSGGRAGDLLDTARRCVHAPGEEPVDRLRGAVAGRLGRSWLAEALSRVDVDDPALAQDLRDPAANVVLHDDPAMNLVYDAVLALRDGTLPLQEVLDTLAGPAATTPMVRALVLTTELGVTTLALARSVSWSPSPEDQERLEADAAVLASAVRALDELAAGLAEPHADVLAAARGVAERCGLLLKNLR